MKAELGYGLEKDWILIGVAWTVTLEKFPTTRNHKPFAEPAVDLGAFT